MAEPTKRPWHDGSGTIAVWYGGEFAKLSQDNYRYAAKCVNALHAARITHAEELRTFIEAVRWYTNTPTPDPDAKELMDSLDRLTATVSTEDDVETT